MPEWICDTSPLQYLHQTNLLDIIPALLPAVVIPKQVAAELAEGRRIGIDLPSGERLKWAVAADPIDPGRLERIVGLGAGERAVLTLALERSGRGRDCR